MTMEHIRVGGVPAAIADEGMLVKAMVADCRRKRADGRAKPTTVFDTNGHAISLYRTDPTYAKAIDSADIVHADGQFVVFFSGLLGSRAVPSRTATTDLIHAAARTASEHGLSFYLLGASEKVSRICASKLSSLYPALRLAGRHHGYFSEQEEGRIVEEINESNVDVLWVGLGKPREQLFCIRNRNKLNSGWLVTCGGCFNFLADEYTRAPKWMQSAGLEWLHRAVSGPPHLRRRYFITVPHAIWLACLGAMHPASKAFSVSQRGE